MCQVQQMKLKPDLGPFYAIQRDMDQAYSKAPRICTKQYTLHINRWMFCMFSVVTRLLLPSQTVFSGICVYVCILTRMSECTQHTWVSTALVQSSH